MTRARVTAQQLTRPPKAARLVRGVVAAVSPLTVQIAGGSTVAGVPIPGATYTVGAAVQILVQEPAIGPVYPIPGTTALPTPVYTRPAAVLSYRGSTDTPLPDNTWQRVPFDTVVVDHLGLNLTGSNTFAVPASGYYRASLRFACTNFIGSGSGVYLASTIANMTQSQDHLEFHGFAIPSQQPMSNHADFVYANAGDVINAAVYKAGAGSNWLCHGSGQLQLAPQITIEHMGAM